MGGLYLLHATARATLLGRDIWTELHLAAPIRSAHANKLKLENAMVKGKF